MKQPIRVLYVGSLYAIVLLYGLSMLVGAISCYLLAPWRLAIYMPMLAVVFCLSPISYDYIEQHWRIDRSIVVRVCNTALLLMLIWPLLMEILRYGFSWKGLWGIMLFQGPIVFTLLLSLGSKYYPYPDWVYADEDDEPLDDKE